MKRERGGLIAIIFIIVAVAAIILAVVLRNRNNQKEGTKLEVGSYTNQGVTEAFRLDSDKGETEAYNVYVTVEGYGGPMEARVKIDAKGEKLQEVEIIAHKETENVGARVAQNSFLTKFKGISLPVALSGDQDASSGNSTIGGNNSGKDDSSGSSDPRKDGVYMVRADEAHNGYISQVSMEIKEGAITDVVWDCFDEEGNTKRMLSQTGAYVMTEDGPLWSEQADALAAYVIEHQGVDDMKTDNEGKTDAISSVSISVDEFISQVRDCLAQAEGKESEQEQGQEEGQDNGQETGEAQGTAPTTIDAITGATVSSRAVITGIQAAYDFVKGQLK